MRLNVKIVDNASSPTTTSTTATTAVAATRPDGREMRSASTEFKPIPPCTSASTTRAPSNRRQYP